MENKTALQNDNAAPVTNMEWNRRLKAIIPHGCSTCSKAPVYLPEEPAVIVRGKGCRIWDADGREFIDFRNSLGPITLGYQFPEIDNAIIAQLKNGISFGHPHPLECEVAELIKSMVPCAEKVRFLKTGGEAAAASIRIARGVTSKKHIIQIGYNGWLNVLASDGIFLPGQQSHSAPPGVPQALSDLHHNCDWNDCSKLEQLFEIFKNDIAAVVVAANYEFMHQGKEFYPFLREITRKNNALLIYDEIVTGFRVAQGGVQQYFSVTPDMAVFAKGIANGMPLSAYCGSAEIMDAAEKLKIIISSTLGGETLSLAAAKAALTFIKTNKVTDKLWQKGESMWGRANELFAKYDAPLRMKGFWPCAAMICESKSPGFKEKFMRSAFKNGLCLYIVNYTNYSHTDECIDEAIERLEKALKETR